MLPWLCGHESTVVDIAPGRQVLGGLPPGAGSDNDEDDVVNRAPGRGLREDVGAVCPAHDA